MTFTNAVKTCFRKYTVFAGRASRSEYWYWALFNLLVGLATSIVSAAAGLRGTVDELGALINLAVLLRGLAVGVRRLHDLDRSGWWLFLNFVPVIGWIIFCWSGTARPAPPDKTGLGRIRWHRRPVPGAKTAKAEQHF